MGVIQGVTRTFGHSVLKMKKQSPHIFFAVGVVGAVTSTVLACRATLKLPETLNDIQNEINDVKTLTPMEGKYTETDHAKDMVFVHAKAGFKLAKLYAPAAVVGSVSIGMLTGSHVQLTRRNTALMAAYAALEQAFGSYRDRVREAIGEEYELDFYRGTKTETVVGEDGKEVDVPVFDPNKYSAYAKIFDELSPYWEKDAELNMMFLRCQQSYANHKLQSRGYIFLNDVYDQLGIERTKAGQIVGWFVGNEGDNHVDFGIYEAHNAQFVNGNERSIILDFNVDGVIYDKI